MGTIAWAVSSFMIKLLQQLRLHNGLHHVDGHD